MNWLTAAAVRLSHWKGIIPLSLPSVWTHSFRIYPALWTVMHSVLHVSAEGSGALCFSLCQLSTVWGSTEFSARALRPGGSECAGGGSSSRLQRCWPRLSPRTLQVSEGAGQAQAGQGIQGAVRVHHHVNDCYIHKNIGKIIMTYIIELQK